MWKNPSVVTTPIPTTILLLPTASICRILPRFGFWWQSSGQNNLSVTLGESGQLRYYLSATACWIISAVGIATYVSKTWQIIPLENQFTTFLLLFLVLVCYSIILTWKTWQIGAFQGICRLMLKEMYVCYQIIFSIFIAFSYNGVITWDIDIFI